MIFVDDARVAEARQAAGTALSTCSAHGRRSMSAAERIQSMQVVISDIHSGMHGCIFTQGLSTEKDGNHPSPPRSAVSQCRLRRIGVILTPCLCSWHQRSCGMLYWLQPFLSVERCSSPDDNVWTFEPVTAKRPLLSKIVGQRRI